MSAEIAVAILAGGEGRRIGGGKALKVLAGERLIDRALRNARRWSDLVAVAVRSAGQVERLDARLFIDEQHIDGPLAGLVAALRFGSKSGCEFVLVIPADMPFLPSNLLSRLRSQIGDLGCAMASSGDHLHPVCALWRTSALNRADEFIASKRRSLRGFAELIGFVTVDWSTEPFDPFFNINSKEELDEAERRTSSEV